MRGLLESWSRMYLLRDTFLQYYSDFKTDSQYSHLRTLLTTFARTHAQHDMWETLKIFEKHRSQTRVQDIFWHFGHFQKNPSTHPYGQQVDNYRKGWEMGTRPYLKQKTNESKEKLSSAEHGALLIEWCLVSSKCFSMYNASTAYEQAKKEDQTGCQTCLMQCLKQHF